MFRFLKILVALFFVHAVHIVFSIASVLFLPFLLFELKSSRCVTFAKLFFRFFCHRIWKRIATIVQHPSNLNRIIWIPTFNYYTTKLLIQKHTFFVLQWYTLHYCKREYTQHFHVHFFRFVICGCSIFCSNGEKENHQLLKIAISNRTTEMGTLLIFFSLSIPTSILHLERVQFPFSCKNWANSIE